MSKFSRIENAIETCRAHINSLDPTDIANKELETYLVAGLVVLIVSEYEDYLELVFARRADACGDGHVSNYIKKSLSQSFRSPDLKKINETLSRFDLAYKTSFMSEIENSPAHAAWDSIMRARHAVVHKKGSLNLTFGELVINYQLTCSLISKVELVLGV